MRGSEWNIASLLVNHHRQIETPRLPKLGSQWTLQVTAKPDHATTTQLAIPFLGTASLQLALPNSPAFAGLELFCQALVLHTAGLADARFTNVLRDRLVR